MVANHSFFYFLIVLALGSPLVYLDQYRVYSANPEVQEFGRFFASNLCGSVVSLFFFPFFYVIANISRVFYWLGDRFDTALLVQSLLMIAAQLALLRLCLKYSPITSPHGESQESNNEDYYYSIDSYLDLFALLFAIEAALFILFQQHDSFIQAIGFFSLGLESTFSRDNLFFVLFQKKKKKLPIPQLLTNFRRKSLAGLSNMVLLGWLFGDSFKSIYLVFVSPDSNSIQFKIWSVLIPSLYYYFLKLKNYYIFLLDSALFQLSVDILILAQAFLYRRQTKLETHPSPDDDLHVVDVDVATTRLTIVENDEHLVVV
ncbi:hypothetical protein VP01_764g1 [Puccinia sorghi]|uniref:Uncharacterized protein n=1 Tax=Puccinia sorghi TaxID=27349 RepID=A0A0L6UDU4_9BASI|nr:hypothetical protein VP01_764g1 [Puccinia sorghi]